MASSRNTPLRRGVLGAVALLGAAWLVPADAVRAEDVGRRAGERAEDACLDLLHDRGFKSIDMGDMSSSEDGNKVVVEVEAKRKGNERDVTCIYDRDRKQAWLRD